MKVYTSSVSEPKRRRSNGIAATMSIRKPTLKVMNCYLPGMTNHFIVLIYICSPKVYEYVNNKHNIHYEVYDIEWVIVPTITSTTVGPVS